MSEKTNLETLQNARRVSAGESHIYVVDHAAMIRSLAEQSVKSLVIDHASYAENDSHMISSQLKISQDKVANKGTTWIYEGEVKFDRDAPVNQDMYFTQLAQLLKEEGDYNSLQGLTFNNIKLLQRKDSDIAALVGFYPETHEVRYRNEFSGAGSRDAWRYVTMKLAAPTVEAIGTEGRDQQFLLHIKGYLLALNALARAVHHGQRAFRVSIVRAGRKIEYQEDQTPEAVEEVSNHSEQEQPQEPERPLVAVEPKLRLDDIGGLEAIKADMKRVVYSYKHPDIMKKWGTKRPQGVLLYGPPGTGKTTIAEAVANEINGTLWEINASSIYDKWLGNSEKNIDVLFDEAEAKSEPTVMLLDEFEGIINNSDSSDNGGATRISVTATFKKRIARLNEKNPNVIVFATTNNIEAIDESLLRAGRFDSKHYVPLPDDAARIAIFAARISMATYQLSSEDFSPFANDIDLPMLAEKTNGMSGADIVEVLRRAQFEKAMVDASGNQDDSIAGISNADLLRHIADLRRS